MNTVDIFETKGNVCKIKFRPISIVQPNAQTVENNSFVVNPKDPRVNLFRKGEGWAIYECGIIRHERPLKQRGEGTWINEQIVIFHAYFKMKSIFFVIKISRKERGGFFVIIVFAMHVSKCEKPSSFAFYLCPASPLICALSTMFTFDLWKSFWKRHSVMLWILSF